MRCPADCDTHLVMAERSGIEIDYCPNCRGVWLDRGELDKIIERSAQASASAPPPPPQYQEPPYQEPHYQEPRYQEPRYDDRHRYDDDHRRYDDDRRYGYGKPPKKKKKKEFLEDLFDFG
jgi:uncharacterized protein